jgi:hypothetical protein
MAFVRGGEVGEVLFEMVHGNFEARFGGVVFYLNFGVVIEGFGAGDFDKEALFGGAFAEKIDEFFGVGEIFEQERLLHFWSSW